MGNREAEPWRLRGVDYAAKFCIKPKPKGGRLLRIDPQAVTWLSHICSPQEHRDMNTLSSSPPNWTCRSVEFSWESRKAIWF